MGWERSPGPIGYDWSFVGLEYYALILNRTFKIFVTEDAVAGAIVRGWLPAPPLPSDAWLDPDFYPRERILPQYLWSRASNDECSYHYCNYRRQ